MRVESWKWWGIRFSRVKDRRRAPPPSTHRLTTRPSLSLFSLACDLLLTNTFHRPLPFPSVFSMSIRTPVRVLVSPCSKMVAQPALSSLLLRPEHRAGVCARTVGRACLQPSTKRQSPFCQLSPLAEG